MASLTSECSNQEAFKRVFSSLFTVSSRRTSDSFAALALNSIKDSLKLTYSFDFLNYVDITEQGIDVDEDVLEDVDSEVLVNVFDSVTRVIYTDLDEKAGLFFIKELKEEIGTSLVSSLADHGLNFDLMALEQRHLQRRRSEKNKQEQKEIIINLTNQEGTKKELFNNLLDSTIHSCHIHMDDLTCTFFDESNNEITNAPLNTFFYSFLNALKAGQVKNEEITFSDATIHSFLQLLQADEQVSISQVKQKLHFSMTQMDQLIRHLLKKKLVKYQTISQIVITDKGKAFVKSL